MAGRPKKVAVSNKSVAEVVESVKSIDLKTELDAFALARLTIDKQLNDANAVVNERISRISDLDVAIEAKLKQLEELSGLESELLDRKVIHDEINALHEDYEVEKVRLAKERKREQEDYDIEFARRKKAQEVLLSDKLIEHNKLVAARDAELKEREKALVTLQAQVDAIPKLVSDAEKRQEAIVSARLTKEFEHQKRVSELESNNALSLVQNKLDSAITRIATLETQNDKLSSEVINARKDANDVVRSTVEANAQRTAYENLLSQVKNGESVTGKR